MTDKDSNWQEKAKQYLRAEKKQLKEERREADLAKQHEEKEKDEN